MGKQRVPESKPRMARVTLVQDGGFWHWILRASNGMLLGRNAKPLTSKRNAENNVRRAAAILMREGGYTVKEGA